MMAKSVKAMMEVIRLKGLTECIYVSTYLRIYVTSFWEKNDRKKDSVNILKFAIN